MPKRWLSTRIEDYEYGQQMYTVEPIRREPHQSSDSWLNLFWFQNGCSLESTEIHPLRLKHVVRGTTSYVLFHFIEQRLMTSDPTRLAIPGIRFLRPGQIQIHREHRIGFITYWSVRDVSEGWNWDSSI